MSLAGSHTDEVFTDLLVPPGPAPKASFERVRFERCTFTGARLAGWHLDDVTFDRCELTTASLMSATLRDVQFLDCRMMGIGWSKVSPLLLSARFTRCRMDNSSFVGMKLKGLRFDACALVGADFSAADLSALPFPGCDLTDATFRQAILVGADLTGARGARLDPKSSRMRGTKVNLDTISLLSRDLGLSCPDLDRLFD